MKKTFADSAAISIPPPVFFFVCLGCGLLMESLFPIQLIRLSPVLRVIVGGILMLVSGYLAASAFLVLINNRTTFNTSKATSRIVEEGAYRFSRNPLYLSLLMLLLGVAILLPSLWVFCTIPILYLLFLFKAVRPEESYLSRKFGEEYVNYSKRVRRWI